MPVPLVGAALLAHNVWVLHLTVRSGKGAVEERDVAVELRSTASPRMFVPAGTLADAYTDRLPPYPRTAIPAEEIADGPLLLFAGCDLLVLPPEVQDRLAETRALDLLAAGVQLVVPGDAPPSGALSPLVWQRLEIPDDSQSMSSRKTA